MQKVQPKTIKLKTSAIVGACLITGGILFAIVYNIYRIRPGKPQAEPTETVSTKTTTNRWWVNTPVYSAVTSPVVTRTAYVPPQASMSTELKQQTDAQNQAAQEAYLQAMRQPLNPSTVQPYSYSTVSVPPAPVATSSPIVDSSPGSKWLNKASQTQDTLLLTRTPPIGKYMISMGSVIPAVLSTGINSDLPGQITGQVTRDVFDSRTHKYLLIPQGSTLVGIYDSSIVYGQSRVLVAWKRINYPDGSTLDLAGMPGTDPAGFSGFKDLVDNHYGRLFGSVLLLSVLTAGAQLSQPPAAANTAPTVGQTVAGSLGVNIANAGMSVVNKNLNIQPTIKIRPGYRFDVAVTKDIVFAEPYSTN